MMKRNYLKQVYLGLVVSAFVFQSCSSDDDNTTSDVITEFPESIISYDYPLGTTDISGQSPINLVTGTTTAMSTEDLSVHYNTITLSSIEHTVENLKINLSEEQQALNYITIDGLKYELLQFHFHRHSEHQLDGEYKDMEVHFVHKSSTGAYAVIGVFLEEDGVDNVSLETLIENSPSVEGINETEEELDLNLVLPTNTSNYFAYSGSLTTPNLDLEPNQGPLTWIMLKDDISISVDQVNKYAEKYEEENFRVIQPLNGRTVYENN